MATISSPGIGSGLDVKSIVSQLVAIEKAPLKQLETQATSFKTRLSVYGTIKSQVSALGDAAAKLSTSAGWNALTSTSSNPSAVSVTTSAGAAATGLTLEVQQLARAQSTASTAVATGSGMGTGTMTISLGTWAGGAFTAGTGTPVEITINPGQDSLTAIAARINEAGAGVSATVLRDATGERLLMRSSSTGEAHGFRIDVAESGDPGLSRLAYDGGGTGMAQTQAAQNALATVNGVAVVSATNRMTDTLPGLTVQLSQVTTEPVEIDVSIDPEGARKNVQAFVDAYNTLTKTLAEATKYDPTSKTAGALQGDSTAVGLQNALRSMMRSVSASSPFSRLADVGIEAKNGGELSINATRFDAALTTNYEGLRQLFTVANENPTAQGFGLKIRTFAQGLIDSDGVVTSRSEAIQNALNRNGKEQDKVNDRAARAEVRLLEQYNAMDAAVGKLSGLNAFVTQQVALWNRSTA